ncbi:MAG: molybdenum ABC transporter ATP-binding protein [Gammaproteobacteria bacterium]
MTIKAKFEVDRGDFNLDIDLSVPSRGITALFGPSGCGKTTLLQAMAGLENFRGGFLQVGELTWQDAALFVPPHQRSLGYIFQEASLFAHLNVRANLEYGVKRVPTAERKVSLEQAIELLGIDNLLERKTDQLSGGERQRVAIARALAVSPKLLLMDEPLAGLDQKRKQEIVSYIDTLHKELDIPVVYVSHATDEVARLADYLVLMDSGKVIASGAIQEMVTRLDLPLAHDNDASAIVEAVVAGHDMDYHLTHLDAAGCRYTVMHKELPVGSSVRLRVAARDVSLTLETQSDTSILNIFPATVDEIVPAGMAQMTVRLTVGGAPMLAHVTRKSASLLDLQPGKTVYAQAKSVALLY